MNILEQMGHGHQRHLPAVATVGTFDGVHLGHRYLIDQVREEAVRRGLRSMVITFDRHPATFFGNHKPLLTTKEEKINLIKATETDSLVILSFDHHLATLTAHEFMQRLHSQLHVEAMVVGYDNHFGSDQVQVSPETTIQGIDIIPAKAWRIGTLDISSTAIRSDLQQGNVEQAGVRLGRPYALTGTVVHGRHIGTRLGFPTANLHVAGDRLIPRPGVYAVRVGAEAGILNIGTRPTFKGQEMTVEVHIIGCEKDLYGQTLTVSFVQRLRDEQTFLSPEHLAAQLQKDKEKTIQLFRL